MPLHLGISAVEEVEELQKALDSMSASGSSLYAQLDWHQ